MRPIIEKVHGKFVHTRRDRKLCDHIFGLLPANAKVLDVGCGDGLLSKMILERRPDVQMTGLDVMVREHTHIPVQHFDGTCIPFPDQSVDAVMFVDVLHHTEDPMILLKEATRVARNAVVIKDHTMNGLFAGPTLRFMDEVGNRRHGVVIPYNYWKKGRWMQAFTTLHLQMNSWIDKLGLYPIPADWVFGRSLHFVARLDLGREQKP